MRPHSVFDPSTGLFTGNVVGCSDDQLAANVPAALRAMPGRFDHRSQRVDVMLLEASRGDHSEPSDFVVDHQTPRPSPDHDWVAEQPAAQTRAAQRWRWVKRPEILDYELQSAEARRAIAAIETAQIRTLREALLGDPEALDRLREQQPAIDAARAVLRRPRPSGEPSAPSPAAPAPPLPE